MPTTIAAHEPAMMELASALECHAASNRVGLHMPMLERVRTPRGPPRMRAFRSDARRPSAVETNLLQYIVAEKFIGARGHVLRSRKDIGAVGVR